MLQQARVRFLLVGGKKTAVSMWLRRNFESLSNVYLLKALLHVNLKGGGNNSGVDYLFWIVAKRASGSVNVLPFLLV